MLTMDLYFARLLSDQINKLIMDQTSNLIHAQDWADHKYRCGYIKALQDILEVGADVQKKMSKS